MLDSLGMALPQGRLDAVQHDRAQPDPAPKIAASVHARPEFGNVIHRLANEDREEKSTIRHDLRAE